MGRGTKGGGCCWCLCKGWVGWVLGGPFCWDQVWDGGGTIYAMNAGLFVGGAEILLYHIWAACDWNEFRFKSPLMQFNHTHTHWTIEKKNLQGVCYMENVAFNRRLCVVGHVLALISLTRSRLLQTNHISTGWRNVMHIYIYTNLGLYILCIKVIYLQ